MAKGQISNSYIKIIASNNELIIYYRLKMIDRNGQFVYSNIVTVKKNILAAPISILNNPANSTLSITIQDGALQGTAAKIINVQGAVVLTVLLQNNIQQIDISKLPNGNYIIQTLKGISRFIIIK
jgi:Secretion system C-terminal sorting domain